MKIDIHSHILPGIDDGASNIEESMILIRAMKSWGFERVTCTPHVNALYRNTPEIIRTAFDQLAEAVQTENIDIELRMSAEYRLVPQTWPDTLKENSLMPIEDRFILMELPINKPWNMGDIKPMEEFQKIMAMGLTPVLPHPERYRYLDEKTVMSYAEAGVKIQCNYGSLAGIYGEDVKISASYYISKGIVTFLATDLHNVLYVERISEWLKNGNSILEHSPMDTI